MRVHVNAPFTLSRNLTLTCNLMLAISSKSLIVRQIKLMAMQTSHLSH